MIPAIASLLESHTLAVPYKKTRGEKMKQIGFLFLSALILVVPVTHAAADELSNPLLPAVDNPDSRVAAREGREGTLAKAESTSPEIGMSAEEVATVAGRSLLKSSSDAERKKQIAVKDEAPVMLKAADIDPGEAADTVGALRVDEGSIAQNQMDAVSAEYDSEDPYEAENALQIYLLYRLLAPR